VCSVRARSVARRSHGAQRVSRAREGCHALSRRAPGAPEGSSATLSPPAEPGPVTCGMLLGLGSCRRIPRRGGSPGANKRSDSGAGAWREGRHWSLARRHFTGDPLGTGGNDRFQRVRSAGAGQRLAGPAVLLRRGLSGTWPGPLITLLIEAWLKPRSMPEERAFLMAPAGNTSG
jgi:hypothetical protein